MNRELIEKEIIRISFIFVCNDIGLIFCIIWQGIVTSQNILLLFGPILYLSVLSFLIWENARKKDSPAALKIAPNNNNFYYIIFILVLTGVAIIIDDVGVGVGFAGFMEGQRGMMGINHLAYLLILIFFIILSQTHKTLSKEIPGVSNIYGKRLLQDLSKGFSLLFLFFYF